MAMIMNVCQWQYNYVTAEQKFLMLMAGRRAGKTHAIKCRMLNDAVSTPGFKSLYLTPYGSLCNEIFREMRTDKFLKKRIRKIEKAPLRKIFWRNGSVSTFLMFDDPEKVRGFGYDIVYFDEIQKLESLSGKEDFMSVIMPLVMDRSGIISISGQYRGRGCWWNKLFLENKDDPTYRKWEIPSWEGWLFKELGEKHPEIVRMKNTLSDAEFGQEVACKATANANAAFKPEYLKECTAGKLEKPKKKTTYVIGCDLGKTVDPSFWVVMDVEKAHVVFSQVRKLGERHEVGAQKLRELSLRYNNAEVFMDTTGGGGGNKVKADTYIKLYRKVLPSLRPIQLQSKNKNRLVEQLQLSFEMNELTIPEKADLLLEQLEGYEFKQDSWGNFSYQGLNGHEDDGPIALMLAWEGHRVSSYGS